MAVKIAGKLHRPSTVDIVANELRRQILAGELKEGEPLLQVQLGEELGVSRIPVREALRQLEAEGLVTMESHKGGVVSELSLPEIAELFAIRQALETWLLGEAIPKMTEVHFAKARGIAETMLVGEVDHWGALNFSFHEALYAAADRPTAMRMIRQLHQNIDRYLRLQITLTSGWQKAQEEHLAILEFCESGKVEKAVAALRDHIGAACGELLEVIEARRKTP
jgi:DNA-binding GntR family transcriptional regulator